MEKTQIKGTGFLTFFSKKGIEIGNYFISHKELKECKINKLRSKLNNMPKQAKKDFINNIKTFKKLYKELQKWKEQANNY